MLVEITDFVLHAVKKKERMKERKLCFDLDTRHTRENATNLFLRLQFSFANRNKENERCMDLEQKKMKKKFLFLLLQTKKSFSVLCLAKMNDFLSLCADTTLRHFEDR